MHPAFKFSTTQYLQGIDIHFPEEKYLTNEIHSQLKAYFATITPMERQTLDFMFSVRGIKSFWKFDFDVYIPITLRKKSWAPTDSHSFNMLVADVKNALLGYYSELGNSIVDNWIKKMNHFLKHPEEIEYWKTLPLAELKKELDNRVFIKFFSKAISNVGTRQVKSLQLESEKTKYKPNSGDNPTEADVVIQFTPIDKGIKTSGNATAQSTLLDFIPAPEQVSESELDRGRVFIQNAIQLLDRDSIMGEILHLFLNGISRKEMMAYIQKFGVNGKGGTHSEDKELTVRIAEVDNKGKVWSRVKAGKTTRNQVKIVIEAKYERISHQVLQFYLNKLRTFLHEFWNQCEAIDETEAINTQNQAGTQFLNWNVTSVNAY